MAGKPEEVEITGEPTILYRLYAADGRILYVGITTDIRKRLVRHKREKSWWSEVTRKTMCCYGSELEASGAEEDAILTEKPLHNVRSTNGTSGRLGLSGSTPDMSQAEAARQFLARAEPGRDRAPTRKATKRGVITVPGGRR